MSRLAAISVALAMLAIQLAGAGCDDSGRTDAARDSTSPPARARSSRAAPSSRPAEAVRIVFLGDSLTAGLGLSADEAFPALLGKRLRERGLEVQIVNAGVSGDTTAGGLRRLDWILRQRPGIVVVGLGGNDGLRALPVSESEQNLSEIITRSRAAGAEVLLLGMLIPPNYGPEYTSQFRDIYPRVARELDVPLVPFLLEGVGGVADMNQPDGIHPTAAGHQIIAETLLPHLLPLVRERAPASPATRESSAAN